MDTVKALNTISGQVADVAVRIVNHAVLGKNLVAVGDDTKSYSPDLYKSKTKEEFTSSPRRGRKGKSEESEAIEKPIAEPTVAESFDTTIDEDN